MSATTSRGVLLFAENNKRLNYLKLAVIAAKCIKNNMGESTNVAVVTTQQSINWFKEDADQLKIFDKIIIRDSQVDASENLRLYRDTRYHSVQDLFLNKNRFSAYALTPYDETILVDADYFVLNDSLNAVWGNNEEFLINKKAHSLMHVPLSGPEFRLNPYGIRMYWATLIYFKKGPKAKFVFELVDHIKECWDYYKHVYDFPGTLFRNDFAFSIALHMLNGFSDDEDFVKPFPMDHILTALDTDQFIDFEDKKTVKFFVNDEKENYKFYVTKVRDVNVHCLNKISILNKAEEILKAIS